MMIPMLMKELAKKRDEDIALIYDRTNGKFKLMTGGAYYSAFEHGQGWSVKVEDMDVGDIRTKLYKEYHK